MPPNREQPNGNGMENPRVFDTLEEALADTDPVEEEYLESLDPEETDDEQD